VSEIFQEVEEEFRREQMAKLWAKYRIPVVGGAVALVLAVAGYQGWTYWQAERISASSRSFDAAVQLQVGQNTKGAAEGFAKLSAEGTSGYAILAKFQEAALRAEMGEQKTALKLYEEISRESADPLFRDFAMLRSGLLTIESAALGDTKKRIEQIATGSGPWRVLAMELLAYASWREGKNDEALKLYAQIDAIPSVPANTKRRAMEMKALIEGGLTLAELNKLPAAPSTPSSLPGSMLLPPEPSAPSSLLGPADALVLPDPTQPPTP
jgi:hypothetical protein